MSELWLTAKQNHQCQCHLCFALNSEDEPLCWQCGGTLHGVATKSIQQTLALLFTSVLLFIPANFLPMMTTTYLANQTDSTILGGVILLWQHQSYLVAVIIFMASIVIPVGKIIALIWLCYAVQFKQLRTSKSGHRLYRIIDFIGRWSMIDVYVVAILVAMIQMGSFMSIQPGVAAIAFSGLVITTMFAAKTFEPRLLWRHTE